MTFARNTSALACGLAAAIALASNAHAADIDVRSGGSILNAIRSAHPGDRVLVHAGTYTGGDWIGPVNGAEGAPITVLSADGPRAAVIQGGGETLRIGDASSYLVFDGFEVRNSGDNLIHLDGQCHHITLRNLYAHDAGFNGDVVKVNQCHDITLELSEVARPGQRDDPYNPYQECVDFLDVDNAAIRDNYIHDGGSMLAYIKGGSRNGVMERNTFSNQRAGASDPMVGIGAVSDSNLLQGEQYEAINTVFRNNILVGGAMGALGVYDANGAYIADNLFVNNDTVLIQFRAGNGPAQESNDVRVVNNVMLDTRGRMPVPYQRQSHGLRNFTTSNNLFWDNGTSIPTTDLLDLASQPGQLVADPLIAAPASTADRATILATARPRAGSPAIGSGADVSGSPFFVADDITGAARGASRDRGPYLLSGDVTPPPTDAGTPPPADSGASGDASVPPTDAGVPADDAGAPGTDAGSTHDAGSAHDAGGDGSSGDDSGKGNGGCDVRGPGGNGMSAALGLLALGAALTVARRRRAR